MEPNQRCAVCRPNCEQDWEPRKALILELYGCMGLVGLMKVMEEKHLFKATENQYKKQFGKWNLRKNTTAAEYKAMIRKKRKRERFGKARSAFRLRGAVVEDSDIVRFQKRKKIRDDEEMSEVATPSSLSCYTPMRDVRSRSPSLAHSIVASSPNQAFDHLIRWNTPSSIISPGKRRNQAFLSEWYPAFDEYINLSAVDVLTCNYDHSFFYSLESLFGAEGPLILALLVASTYGEKESIVTSYIGAMTYLRSVSDPFPDSRSRTHRMAYILERLSEENSAKEPTRGWLSYGNITYVPSQFNDLEYSGSTDPTLTEALTWNELEIC